MRVYLDHNATTPVRDEVIAAMAACLRDVGGNPSSPHAAGRAARDAVERARREVAALVAALAEEIVFTSGGTEGDHLAIRGLALAARARVGGRVPHVVTSPIEHPAVLGAAEALRRDGFEVTEVRVGPRGEIAPEELRRALRPETVLVSLAAVNHELGNIYPVRELAEVARAGGALFHTDAVQAAGRMPLDLTAAGVDAATISAHKLHGPKGVGALFVRRGVDLAPIAAGGHQERERRAGTENVPGIVGFGVAAALARRDLADDATRIAALRDRLEAALLVIPGARLHGVRERRVPGTLNVAFAGAPGQLVVIGLDLEGVCASTGSACTSGSVRPSPVLLALGLDAKAAGEAVRLSLGRDTTEADIDRVAALLPAIVERIRAA